MKIKTSELMGAALDWAVMRAINVSTPWRYWGQAITAYSTNWSQGGPILDREGIATSEIPPVSGGNGYIFTRRWIAEMFRFPGGPRRAVAYGTTPLVAAMRCFVMSKLGCEVEIPDELAADQSAKEGVDAGVRDDGARGAATTGANRTRKQGRGARAKSVDAGPPAAAPKANSNGGAGLPGADEALDAKPALSQPNRRKEND